MGSQKQSHRVRRMQKAQENNVLYMQNLEDINKKLMTLATSVIRDNKRLVYLNERPPRWKFVAYRKWKEQDDATT